MSEPTPLHDPLIENEVAFLERLIRLLTHESHRRIGVNHLLHLDIMAPPELTRPAPRKGRAADLEQGHTTGNPS